MDITLMPESPEAWICPGALLLWTLATVAVPLRPLRRAACGAFSSADRSGGKDVPYVSVVAMDSHFGEGLDEYIEALEAQESGGGPDYELIIVCDAPKEVVSQLEGRYAHIPWLRFTFIPPGSRNLSRRKLAYTIGMKAARGEVVLTTSTDCIPDSDIWLRQMAAPFSDPAVEVVLGDTVFDYSGMPRVVRGYRAFQSVADTARWMDAAKFGRPYRGDVLNLAMRRSLFFEHKGYASSVMMHPGEDDIFISEVATPENTRVVADVDAILYERWGERASNEWLKRKEAQIFTSHYLRRMPFRAAGFLSLSQWGILLLSLLAVLVSLPALLPASAAVIILLLFWTGETVWTSRAARMLTEPSPGLLTPVYMLWRPIGTFLFRLRYRPLRKKNFTFSS